MTKLAPAK